MLRLPAKLLSVVPMSHMIEYLRAVDAGNELRSVARASIASPKLTALL
jgi:hypothetical protein